MATKMRGTLGEGGGDTDAMCVTIWCPICARIQVNFNSISEIAMKLILNLAGEKREREFLDPDGTVVMAAIKSLKYDSTLLLEDGADFVNCWTEDENSFQCQYQDGKTLTTFIPLQERITSEQLASIFMKFLRKDDSWKNDLEFQLAPEQPDCMRPANPS